MPDRKKHPLPVWDWIFSDEESDMPLEALPEMPENLAERVKKALDKPARLEILRGLDPSTRYYRKALAEFQEKYSSLKEEPKQSWLSRLYHSLFKKE